MGRRDWTGALLALVVCVACVGAAPAYSNETALDTYGEGSPEGCYYNFQHYGEGDRIMTNEPCLNCTCHNRMLMCYLRVCPFTKAIGQDCTIEKRADQCCPIITCPDVPVDLLTSTSTTSPAEYGLTGVGHLDKFGCSIHGKYYPEGAKVPPSPNKPCEHCYCIRNMTACVMQECTLNVAGCTPIYHKDVCCPVRYSCDHPEDMPLMLDDMTTTIGTTPGIQWTTTVAPSVIQSCVHGDETFEDGALIKTEKACEHCYCMKGDIVCVVQECGTPMENEGKNCTSMAPREGQCCPDTYICEGDNEIITDETTTTKPPRRILEEGSGYRSESDEQVTEPIPFKPEHEGSGHSEESIGEAMTTTEYSVPVVHSESTTPITSVEEEELAQTLAQDHSTTDDRRSSMTSISDIGDVSKETVVTEQMAQEMTTVKEKDILDEVTTSSVGLEAVKTTLSDTTDKLYTTIQPDVETEESGLSTPHLGIGDNADKETTTYPKFTELVEKQEPDSHVTSPDEILSSPTTQQSLTEATTQLDHDKYPLSSSESDMPVETASISTSQEPLGETTIAVDHVKDSDSEVTPKTTHATIYPIDNEKEDFTTTADDSSVALEHTTASEIETYTTTKAHEQTEYSTIPDVLLDRDVTQKPSEKDEAYTSYNLEGMTTEAEIVKEPTYHVSEDSESSTSKLSTNLLDTEEETSHETLTEQPDIKEDATLQSIEDKEITATSVSDLNVITVATVIADDKQEDFGETFTTLKPIVENELFNRTISPEEQVSDDKFSTLPAKFDKEVNLMTTNIPEQDHTKVEMDTQSIATSEPYSDHDSRYTVKPDEGLITETTDKEHLLITEQDRPSEGPKSDDGSLVQEKDKTTTESSYTHSDEFNTKEDSATKEPALHESSPLYTDENNLPVDTTTISQVGLHDLHNITDTVIFTTESAIIDSSDITTTPETSDLTSDKDITTIKTDSYDDAMVTTPKLPTSDDDITTNIPITTISQEITSRRTYDSTTVKGEMLSTEYIYTAPTTASDILTEKPDENLSDNKIDKENIPTVLSPGVIPGEGSCLVDSVTYSNNSMVPSTNKCQSACKCLSSIVKCDPILCGPPPENVVNCQVMYDSVDACCPTYVCDTKETIPPQPHNQMVVTESTVTEVVETSTTADVKCNDAQCEVQEDHIIPITQSDLCARDGNNCVSTEPSTDNVKTSEPSTSTISDTKETEAAEPIPADALENKFNTECGQIECNEQSTSEKDTSAIDISTLPTTISFDKETDLKSTTTPQLFESSQEPEDTHIKITTESPGVKVEEATTVHADDLSTQINVEATPGPLVTVTVLDVEDNMEVTVPEKTDTKLLEPENVSSDAKITTVLPYTASITTESSDILKPIEHNIPTSVTENEPIDELHTTVIFDEANAEQTTKLDDSSQESGTKSPKDDTYSTNEPYLSVREGESTTIVGHEYTSFQSTESVPHITTTTKKEYDVEVILDGKLTTPSSQPDLISITNLDAITTEKDYSVDTSTASKIDFEAITTEKAFDLNKSTSKIDMAELPTENAYNIDENISTMMHESSTHTSHETTTSIFMDLDITTQGPKLESTDIIGVKEIASVTELADTSEEPLKPHNVESITEEDVSTITEVNVNKEFVTTLTPDYSSEHHHDESTTHVPLLDDKKGLYEDDLQTLQPDFNIITKKPLLETTPKDEDKYNTEYSEVATTEKDDKSYTETPTGTDHDELLPDIHETTPHSPDLKLSTVDVAINGDEGITSELPLAEVTTIPQEITQKHESEEIPEEHTTRKDDVYSSSFDVDQVEPQGTTLKVPDVHTENEQETFASTVLPDLQEKATTIQIDEIHSTDKDISSGGLEDLEISTKKSETTTFSDIINEVGYTTQNDIVTITEDEFLREKHLTTPNSYEDNISEAITTQSIYEEHITSTTPKSHEDNLVVSTTTATGSVDKIDVASTTLTGDEENIYVSSTEPTSSEENIDILSITTARPEQNVDVSTKISTISEENIDAVTTAAIIPEENIDVGSTISTSSEEQLDVSTKTSIISDEKLDVSSPTPTINENDVDILITTPTTYEDKINVELTIPPSSEKTDVEDKISTISEENNYIPTTTSTISEEKIDAELTISPISDEHIDIGITTINDFIDETKMTTEKIPQVYAGVPQVSSTEGIEMSTSLPPYLVTELGTTIKDIEHDTTDQEIVSDKTVSPIQSEEILTTAYEHDASTEKTIVQQTTKSTELAEEVTTQMVMFDELHPSDTKPEVDVTTEGHDDKDENDLVTPYIDSSLPSKKPPVPITEKEETEIYTDLPTHPISSESPEIISIPTSTSEEDLIKPIATTQSDEHGEDVITEHIPIVTELSTIEPIKSLETEHPGTEIQKPFTTDKPTEIPLPDEDTDHQTQEHFPTSGSSGYGQEPDYGDEDQAFGTGTCRYGGKVYVSAQQIPRDDPCDFCFCFRSDIICLQQSCPPPIHGCHEEPIQGFCCPRYECPVSMATTLNVTTSTTTSTTTLPPHFPRHAYNGAAHRNGCQINGHSYKVGEVVHSSSGPCMHCTCGGDGKLNCDPKPCTPEPMLRQMIAAAVSSKRRR